MGVHLNFVRIALVATAASLAGCAATVHKNPTTAAVPATRVPAEASNNIVLNISGEPRCTTAKDWAGFRSAWRDAVAAEASAQSIPFSMQDGEARHTGQNGTLVDVHVKDYHWVGDGTRYVFGIFTGNAYIQAKVRYIDLKTGKVFGEEDVNTSSTAWQGIFSAMTDKQLAAVAKETVKDVKGS
jgi:hypothetical protein